MSERDEQRPQGVEETASAWETPAPIRARPQKTDFDVATAARETLARFPKIIARLGE